jgi:hypothetical protein
MLNLHIVYEDEISHAMLERIIGTYNENLRIASLHPCHGFWNIKSNMAKYNAAARHNIPFIILTDLDAAPCAPELITEWLPGQRAPLLFFRIAVREVESWLIADREGFAGFLGISSANIPRDPDALLDPKAEVFRLAKKSRSRSLKEDILPTAQSRVGPGYNDALPKFIRNGWNAESAREHSPSLDKALSALAEYVHRQQNHN